MSLPNPEDLKQYAIVVCYYKEKCYVSLPMLLEDNSELTTTIKRISEEGTDMLLAWKMPITENSFMLFSRTQLNETLFEIGTYSGAELKQLIEKDLPKKPEKIDKPKKKTS